MVFDPHIRMHIPFFSRVKSMTAVYGFTNTEKDIKKEKENHREIP